MKIINHRLEGDNVSIQGSPNRGGTLNPDTIIIHYTAGASAASAVKTLTNPDSKASAHVVVDFDGHIIQLVPFNIIAWHAGKSRFQERTGLNKYSIGIEIVNAGRLSKSGSKYYSWFQKEYRVEEVMKAVHRNEDIATYWHRYTEAQIDKVYELCELFVKEYNILHILGHEEISPGRKIDPGPAFPLDKMRNRILQLDTRDQDTDINTFDEPKEGIVTASKLNIRSGPSSGRMKVANPLPQGKKVKILEKSEDWYKVSATIEGWVSAQYIQET